MGDADRTRENRVRRMLARHGRKLAKARRPDDLRRRYSILDHSGSPVLEGISLGNAERVAERYAPGGVKVWFSGDSLYTDGLGGETAARVRAMFRWPPLAVKEPDESCAHAVARAIGEHNEGRGMYVPDDAQCRDGVLVILGKAEEDEREQIWHVVMGSGGPTTTGATARASR